MAGGVPRYRDADGKEHAKHFARKVDAQLWLDQETAELLSGKWVAPRSRNITVNEWCDLWIEGYGSRRASTVRQARTHLAQIRTEFGPLPLGSVRPSAVRSWCARLKNGESPLSQSYVYALHARLSQIMSDAVHDGLIGQNPCSRRTSPGAGKQRAYVATTEQVWALYDAMEARFRLAVLLGAFAGLRAAEACGLRVVDVDFLRRTITPAVQYPAEPLKAEMSRTTIPIADTLVTAMARQIEVWPGSTILTGTHGGQLGPWRLDQVFRRARAAVDGLPDGFRFHDLRHYYASLLIASGADVKVVQARLRHRQRQDELGHLRAPVAGHRGGDPDRG